MPKVINKKKNIILTSRVRNLGKRGDVVFVKPGYFRNFLSKELAVPYSKEKLIEIQETLKTNHSDLAEQESLKNKNILDGKCLYFARQASGTDILFASVSKKDVQNEIKVKFNIEISIKKIYFKEIIKKIGIYTVEIDLSENISTEIKISVGQTIDSAEKMIKELKNQKGSNE